MLYIGVVCVTGNYKTDNILQVMGNCVSAYSLENDSYEEVLEIFQNGMTSLLNRDYQKAIFDFAKAYYCASFRPDTSGIAVNSLINICGIEFLNGRYDDARSYGQRACVLSFTESFYNPYLKYYAAFWTGTVFIQLENPSEAIRHFSLAYQAICHTGENCLVIAALSAMVQLYMQTGNYLESADLIDKILNILQEDKNMDYGSDFILNLARLHSRLYKAVLGKALSEYVALQKEYDEMSRSFLYKMKDYALNLIYRYGDRAVCCALGSFLSGTLQFSISGSNVSAKGDIVINGGQ